MNTKLKKALALCCIGMLILSPGGQCFKEMTASAATSTNIRINSPKTKKKNNSTIRISWGDSKDPLVSKYVIYRRATVPSGENEKTGVNGVTGIKSSGSWKKVRTITSDNKATGKTNYIDDTVGSKKVIYEYRVDTVDKKGFTGYGKSVYGSNLKICIDPGHEGTANNNYSCAFAEERKYSYSEAVTMLSVGKKLSEELKKYGVDSYMTRTSEYTNITTLEGRGNAAGKNNCDFFISLHTNANGVNANGYKTWAQPLSLNKVVILINQKGKSNNTAINIANNIGVKLTNVNKTTGCKNGFNKVNQNNITQWDNSKNDSLNINGTVYCRSGTNGDWYGVLRGASNVGVPGVLVEHAFHTVPAIRKYVSKNGLSDKWAVCDAKGILKGYHLMG